MYENSVITPEMQAAPQKKSGGNWVWITFLVVGLVMLIAGIILYNTTDVTKYVDLKDVSESYSAADVSRLDLNIDWADLTVSKSSDDKIYIDAKNVPESFNAEVRGDTFSTSFNEKKLSFHLAPSWLNGDNNAVIEIKLPEKEYESMVLDLGAGETKLSDMECIRFRVECGAGEVTFNDVKCETGSFECGAGEVNINRIKCSDKLNVDGGAGSVNINSSVIGGLDADQGVGELNFTGTVNGDIDVEGGVGEIVLNLTNPESDFVGSGCKYKMDIETGIGSKTVNYNVSR